MNITEKITDYKFYNTKPLDNLDEFDENALIVTARCDYYGFHCTCKVLKTSKESQQRFVNSPFKSEVRFEGIYTHKNKKCKFRITDATSNNFDNEYDHLKFFIGEGIKICYSRYKGKGLI